MLCYKQVACEAALSLPPFSRGIDLRCFTCLQCHFIRAKSNFIAANLISKKCMDILNLAFFTHTPILQNYFSDI